MVEHNSRGDRDGITPLDTLVAFASRRRLRGAARLRSILRGHHDVALTRVRTADGLLVDLDIDNFLDWAVLDHGYYEREVLDAILVDLTDDGVLWDVGANIGLHALTARHFRPRATVVAFEPAPHTASRLVANADLNRADVRIVTSALADHSGVAELSLATRGNTGLTSLRPWPDVTYETTIVCSCIRADDLVHSGTVPAPSVVKLDVEGFELEVLSGFGNLLAAPELRTIVFEASGAPADRPNDNPVFHMLSTAGFDIDPLDPAHPAEKAVATNFVARRP